MAEASATYDTIAGTFPAAESPAGAGVETRQGVAPEKELDPSVYPCADGPTTKAFEGLVEGLRPNVPDADPHGEEPFLPLATEPYEHSTFAFGKEAAGGPSAEQEGAPPEDTEIMASGMASPGPAVDSRAGDRLPRASKPAGAAPRIPPRVADRPHVEDWAHDALLTLPEASALFWPAGPITTNTLRTAGRDGTLAITKVAGKFFTTPMAIRRMGVADDGDVPDNETAGIARISPQALFEAKLEEARRQGRDRKRRQRAAKRSVALSDRGAGR